MQKTLNVADNKSRNGMTLVELMVATAIFSLILLATTSGSFLGLSEVQNAGVARIAQSFELSHRLQFLDRQTVKSLAAGSEDRLLAKCLNSPCESECRTQNAWRDIKWGNIDLNRFVSQDGNEITLGGRFRSKKDSFDECQLIEVNGVPTAPYFAAGCNFSAKARWKSGGADTVLIEIQLADQSARISRNLSYHVPIEKDPLTQTCQPANAISCGASNVFVTEIDFAAESLKCAVTGR